MSEGDATLAIGAANNVLRHYPLKATQQALDWAMLVIVAGTLYVPRYERWSTRRTMERAGRSPAARAGNGATQPAAPEPAATQLYIEPDFGNAA